MTNAPKRNHGKKSSNPSNRGKRLASMALMSTLALLANSPAEAQALDGTAIQKLALQGTWAAEDGWGYWSWKEDNSVCFRLFEQDAKCLDTGTWTINDNVVCYEFKWWGEPEDVRSQCVSVRALGNDRYETQYYGGAFVSTFFKFRVLD